MIRAASFGILGAGLVLLSCRPSEPLPQPIQERVPVDEARACEAPVRVCPGEAPNAGRVRAMVGWLGCKDEQNAQFAFDALNELLQENPRVRRTIVCYLDDQRPFNAKEVMVLNRSDQAFELVAHYQPRRVFDAVALVLGSPPSLPHACSLRSPSAEADRTRCIDAWRWHLTVKGSQ